MQPNPFHSATKRITKLTGKAKAALDEKLEAKSKKRKNDDSASVDSTRPKKVKATQHHGKNIKEAPPQDLEAQRRRTVVYFNDKEQLHNTVVAPGNLLVRTETEDSEELQNEAIVISEDEDNASKQMSTDDKAETPEGELKRLMKDRTSPIYAFFDPTPTIETKGDQCAHSFKCMAKGCQVKIQRFLNKKDTCSTGNMHKYIRIYWRDEILQAADEVRNAEEVRQGKVTYSHRQHTWTETKAEIVRWVSKNLQPFEIVKDRGFQSLMKTGRLEYYIPSPSTVSQDARLVFTKTRQQIAKMSREYDGKLNFSTDSWTSPNHHAYVALLMHLEHKGIPLCIPLDIVEVPKSHTGEELAAAFQSVLEDFGITEKILCVTVRVVLKGYRIQRALASARTLCPFPEYCPVFQKGLAIASEDPDV